MRLKEWEELPRTALGWIIDFNTPELKPRTNGVVLSLPYADDASFWWIDEEEGPFLFHMPEGNLYYVNRDPGGLFAVEVPRQGLAYLERRGPAAFRKFFRRVRTPQEIRHIEGYWGPRHTKVWADLFRYPLPWRTWEEFLLPGNAERFGSRIGEVLVTDRAVIQGTTSVFSGEYVRVRSNRRRWLFCRGAIATGRYPKLTLPTPHLIAASPLPIRGAKGKKQPAEGVS